MTSFQHERKYGHNGIPNWTRMGDKERERRRMSVRGITLA